MNYLDYLLASLDGFKCGAEILCGIIMFSTALHIGITVMDNNVWSNKNPIAPARNWFLVSGLLLILIMSIPSANDVWKVRVTLLKLEATKDENIKKGLSEVERVAKKIECKYLGCDGDKSGK